MQTLFYHTHSIIIADEEFNDLCFEFGLELDEVVSFLSFAKRIKLFEKLID
jgi:hypothetical protein